MFDAGPQKASKQCFDFCQKGFESPRPMCIVVADIKRDRKVQQPSHQATVLPERGWGAQAHKTGLLTSFGFLIHQSKEVQVADNHH